MTRRPLLDAALALAVLACAVIAALFLHGCATYARLPVQEPPQRYASVETPAVYLEVGKVAEYCAPLNAACAKPIPPEVAGPDWTIITPDPCAYPDQSYARLLCHELAHAKGWRHERN